MNKLEKATIFFILLIVIVKALINIASISLTLSITKYTSSTFQNEGSIFVSVLESGSLTPIDCATVCVIESKTYHTTNKKGLTERITVPLLVNQNYNNSLTPPNGEITLLAYKTGYVDSLLFNVKVPINSTRLTVIIYLSPIHNSNENKPTIASELPNEIWAQQIIKLNKK